MWNPGHLVSKDVEEYLSKSQEAIQTGGVGSLPMGAHVRDDEQVWLWLFLLVDLSLYTIKSSKEKGEIMYMYLLNEHVGKFISEKTWPGNSD